LALRTSLIIFCIVSASYGRVEDCEVIASVTSVVELYGERIARGHKFTHAPMRQDPHEFIVDGGFETTTFENFWKERPVGPREQILTLTTKIGPSIAIAPVKVF